MNARLLLSIGWLAILPAPGWAGPAVPPLDFAAGFEKLVALGLPPLDASAKWVVARQENLPYQFRRAAKSFKGNAWLTGADKDARLVLFGTVVASEGKTTSATPDLDKDIATLLAAIGKSDPDDDKSNDLLGSRYSSSEVAPGILLFATQLYQTGRAAQANQLATALFAAMPAREAVVDGVIELLADDAYARVFQAFIASGDWVSYHRSVGEVFAKFPRGWADREAVALLMPQLEKQAQGVLPPPPASAGVEIDPRAAAIIAELSAKPAGPSPNIDEIAEQEGIPAEALREMSPDQLRMILGSRMSGARTLAGIWLLDAGDAAPPRADQSPLVRLAALKMAALPALAALLGDPFLTHLPNSGSDRVSYGFSGDSPEESLMRKWEALPRPQTRGEIARRMLLATLPDPDDEWAQADDETLRQATLEFWKANQATNREELAAVFLRGGNKNQTSTAVAILAVSSEPKFHQLFEAHVLAQDPAFAAFEEVRTYLKARRAAAKPFFETYAALVREQTPANAHTTETDYDEHQYTLRSLGGVEKLLKSLNMLIEPEQPRAIALRIAKGDPKEAAEALANLRPLMEDLSPLKQLHAWLEGANAATDAAVRAHFLQGALQVSWPQPERVPAQAAADEGKPSPPPPARKVSAPEEKVWRRLMADQRELADDLKWIETNSSRERLVTVAELANAAYQRSVDPVSLGRIVVAAPILGKTFSVLLQETVSARLAGQPLPVLPDAERVSAERLAAIVAEAGGRKPEAIPAYLKTLLPDERAAWAEWLEDPEDPPMPDSVRALGWYVTSRSARMEQLPPLAKTVATIEPGFMLTPEWLVTHLESLAPKIDSFSPYGLFFRGSEQGSGQELEEILIELDPAVVPKPVADEEAGAASDEDELENQLDQVRQIFSGARRVLRDHPEAVAALNIFGQTSHVGSLDLILTKDGKLAVAARADADEPAPVDSLAAIKPMFAGSGSNVGLVLFILTRKHAEILFKDADDEDFPELLPP